MNNYVRFVSVALSAVCAACSQANAPPAVGSKDLGTPIPVVRFRAEPYPFTFVSGLDKPARIVVRDATAWKAIWSEIHSRTSPLPDLPAADFSREMIVVAALGSHSSGGYSILIEGAGEVSGVVNVAIHSIAPGNRCGVTLAFTEPVDIARLPLREGPVRFVERATVTDCQ